MLPGEWVVNALSQAGGGLEEGGTPLPKHIVHLSSCLSTLKAGFRLSIMESSLLVGLGVCSKVRETKFGKSENS